MTRLVTGVPEDVSVIWIVQPPRPGSPGSCTPSPFKSWILNTHTSPKHGVAVGVAVRDGLSVGVRVGLDEGVAVGVRVPVGVADGGTVWVHVGVGVEVRVGVRVNVGVGVKLGRSV